jgi:hypothetical protein
MRRSRPKKSFDLSILRPKLIVDGADGMGSGIAWRSSGPSEPGVTFLAKCAGVGAGAFFLSTSDFGVELAIGTDVSIR